jgi:hypothetical protein
MSVITQNVTSPYFKAVAFIVNFLEKNNYKSDNGLKTDGITATKDVGNNKITLISAPFYSWIPRYVFQINSDYKSYEDDTPIKTDKVVLVVDPDFVDAMSGGQVTTETTDRIKKMYNSCVKHVLATVDPVLICSL